MTQPVLVRFAPSPTGLLHVGNARTALINYLFAHKLGGKFMLRIDDTDLERSKAEYEEGIKRDLEWLGLGWDQFVKQSDRFERYEEARKQLIEMGRLYPCYETAEELEVKRKMLIGRGLPPIYDRAGMTETEEQRKKYEGLGRRPHWRFKLDHAPITWDDMIRGPVQFDGAKLSDPVLFREDGNTLFTLSTSVDDGELPITHIIRGEDHVSNTAIQVQIMQALGHKVPTFGHMALLKMKEGKISKRTGGGDVDSLRTQGVFPLVLSSYLAKIGTSDSIDLASSLQELIESFAINKLGRAMANYDPAELERLNLKYLHHMSYEEAHRRIAQGDYAKQDIGGHALSKTEVLKLVDEKFWNAVRGNLTDFGEVAVWASVIGSAPVHHKVMGEGDIEFTRSTAGLLPDGEWGEHSWDAFVNRVKESSGRKGKELFMPLRLGLTGLEHGPEMKVVFALLGRERARKRLLGEAA